MPESIYFTIVIFAISLYALMKGADWLIDGSSSVARSLKVSELTIGLTVVAFGTSLPELVVSLQAALQGSPELSYANVIGSNIANILLILGATAIIVPLKAPSDVKKDIPFFAAAVLSLTAAVLLGQTGEPSPFLFKSSLGLAAGVILLSFFAGFIWKIFKKSRHGLGSVEEEEHNDIPIRKAWVLVILGLVFIVGGGELTVLSAVSIAQKLGVPESTIGLTIVAFGTSLPELVASLAAAGKQKGDMAIGNILGSNLMNLALVLGSAACVSKIDVAPWGVFDMIVHTLVALIFLALLARNTSKENLGRQTGILFIIMYIAYMTIIGMRDVVTS